MTIETLRTSWGSLGSDEERRAFLVHLSTHDLHQNYPMVGWLLEELTRWGQAGYGPDHKNLECAKVVVDLVLPVYEQVRLNEIFWSNYSYANKGDSANFLDQVSLVLAQVSPGDPWRLATLGNLARIIQSKPIRDWNTLVAILDLSSANPRYSLEFLTGVFVNLLLLKRNLNPRLANDKSDLAHTAYALKRSLCRVLSTVDLDPAGDLHGMIVSIFRFLPQINDEDRIGTIRSLSERFDEDRPELGDPWRTRANAIRKAIHQKPSASNIELMEGYLLEQEELERGIRSGVPDSPEMVELARDLLTELQLFWKLRVDSSAIEAKFYELHVRWKEILDQSHPGEQGAGRLFALFKEALVGENYLLANGYLTQLRRTLKKKCLHGPGEFRFDCISFEVDAEHLSFIYQSTECMHVYQNFSLLGVPRAASLLSQIITSVRASGGGDVQLGRTGLFLDQEAHLATTNTFGLRRIIKDILNQTKAATDRFRKATSRPILSMLAEWIPDLPTVEQDRHIISLYNYYFRSTSFLHLGEFAAFLSSSLLPYGENRSKLSDDQGENDRLVWRFYGTTMTKEELPPEGELRFLVGGKAAGLLHMHKQGFPVPQGFSLTTQIVGGQTMDDAWSLVTIELGHLEAVLGLGLGKVQEPLLVSVRSGSPVSMPGMMDTILNIGLSSQVLEYQVSHAGTGLEQVFWYDCRFTLIKLFSSSVYEGVPMPKLQELYRQWQQDRSAMVATGVEKEKLEFYHGELLAAFMDYVGAPFPEDPLVQLRQAIHAVFASWNSRRAREYRSINHIPEHLGTGVTVQRMVFGNRDLLSASGVFFTRDPEEGKANFGDIVVGGQGEEVVSGQAVRQDVKDLASLAPQAWQELVAIGRRLERIHGMPMDIEFTIEQGVLWILQARPARLTTRGKLFALIDMVYEGIITTTDALHELSVEALEDLDSTSFLQKDVEQAEASGSILAHGLGVYHGVATGMVVFGIEGVRRLRLVNPGCPCILIKEDTKPEDIDAMYESLACATRVGGPTSHAAINARVIGRPCVVNCTNLRMVKDDFDTIMEVQVGDTVLVEGDVVSVDGNRALLIKGSLPVIAPEEDARSRRGRELFLSWYQESEEQRSQTLGE